MASYSHFHSQHASVFGHWLQPGTGTIQPCHHTLEGYWQLPSGVSRAVTLLVQRVSGLSKNLLIVQPKGALRGQTSQQKFQKLNMNVWVVGGLTHDLSTDDRTSNILTAYQLIRLHSMPAGIWEQQLTCHQCHHNCSALWLLLPLPFSSVPAGPTWTEWLLLSTDKHQLTAAVCLDQTSVTLDR